MPVSYRISSCRNYRKILSLALCVVQSRTWLRLSLILSLGSAIPLPAYPLWPPPHRYHHDLCCPAVALLVQSYFGKKQAREVLQEFLLQVSDVETKPLPSEHLFQNDPGEHCPK